MTKRTFEFKKTYEEIDIADKTYKVDISDDKIIGYQESLEKFHKEVNKFKDVKTEDLTNKELKQLYADMRGIMRGVVDELLEDGAYDELYTAAGGSLMNMIDLVEYLGEVIREHQKDKLEQRKNKYLAGKK